MKEINNKGIKKRERERETRKRVLSGKHGNNICYLRTL